MTKDYFKRVQAQTCTKFWINNVTREQAVLALDAGAVGCTQNPSYPWKMLTHPIEGEHTKAVLVEILKNEPDDNKALIALQRELVKDIAMRFLPLYESSMHRLGYVSIQGDPFHEDVKSILSTAHFNREACPNIMAKVPVTKDGLVAISTLAKECIPINATECMTIQQVIDACDAYNNATKSIAHPAPMYFSLITGIFDEEMKAVVEKKNIDIDPDILRQAGMCVARKVHEVIRQRNYPCGFISGGARSLYHFTEMVGANAVVTINWTGTADQLLEKNPPVFSRFLMPTPHLVEDQLLSKIEEFRKAYLIGAISEDEYEDFGAVVRFRSSFEESWKNSLDLISSIR